MPPRKSPYTVNELAHLKGCHARTVENAVARAELFGFVEDDVLYVTVQNARKWKPRGRGAPKGSGKLPDELKRSHLIKTYANDAELKKFHAKIKEGEKAQEAARRLCCG